MEESVEGIRMLSLGSRKVEKPEKRAFGVDGSVG